MKLLLQVVGEQHRMVSSHMRRLMLRGQGQPDADSTCETEDSWFSGGESTLGEFPTLTAKVTARCGLPTSLQAMLYCNICHFGDCVFGSL